MSRSHFEVYIHFVWTTENRNPVLRGDLEQFVHRRITKIAEGHKIDVLAINSAWDHTHVLARWHSTAVISDVVREWKSRTANEWNDPDDDSTPRLKWQTGSGVFSVSPHNVDRLIAYIAKQKRHHRDRTVIYRYEREFGPSFNRPAR